MALVQPPLFLQDGLNYSAEHMRAELSMAMGDRAGIMYPGDFNVTQNGTPNWSINISDGRALVPGTLSTYQRLYFVENRGTVNLAVTPGHATFTRIDLVVLKIEDSEYGGSNDLASLAVVTGTASGSPTAPAAPDNAITLATLTIPGGVGNVINSYIVNNPLGATKGYVTAKGGIIPTLSGTLPSTNLHEGLTVVETDTNRLKIHNGSAYVGAGAYTAPPSQFFEATDLSGTTVAGPANWSVHSNLLVAPYPLTMVVTAFGISGFGTNHELGLAIDDDVSGSLMSLKNDWGSGFHPTWMNMHVVNNEWRTFTLIGKHDYAAGATCGFKLRYFQISAGTTNIKGACRVDFIPKVS